MLKLSELLKLRNFRFEPTRTKLVRHRDTRYDVPLLYHQGWLETYQSFQAKPIFDDCTTLIAFVGGSAGQDRLFGAFRILGFLKDEEGIRKALPDNCPYRSWPSEATRYYRLQRIEGLEDYEDRLVIDWGPAQRAWHQWYQERSGEIRDKEIVEISAPGRRLPPFRDYLRFSLTHRELCTLVRTRHAHPDWHAALKAVGAIYLIVATDTGQQYVGSATGLEGLWQRWESYAATGHGGNVRLQALTQAGCGYPEAFSHSILHTFSKTLTQQEALALEGEFKRKLGARVVGLNAN